MALRLNPYTPGAGNYPDVLAGRHAEIERFGDLLVELLDGRCQRSLMVTGFRGVGKTVLLNGFAALAERYSCKTVFHEIQENASLPRILGPAVSTMLALLRPTSRQRSSVARALAATSVAIQDEAAGVKLRWSADTPDSDTLAIDITEILVQVGQVARERATAAIFLFDELQRARQDELGALLAGLHRVTQLNLPLAAVGAGLPQLEDKIATAQSYGERMFDFVPIGALDRRASVAALTGPATRRGVEYTEDAIELLLSLTEGYPYYLQEYARHTWLMAKGNPIDAADVRRARTPAEEELRRGFIKRRLNRTTSAEREYLEAMAQLGPGPYKITDVEQYARRGSRAIATAARVGLIDKAHIHLIDAGLVQFTVPRFGEFVLRQARTDEIRGTGGQTGSADCGC